ncbi:MAG: N-formylglutamate amidohydrolase [Candidatus Peregrinibacteria bacterium]
MQHLHRVLLDLPHAGAHIPPEVKPYVSQSITPNMIAEHRDTGSRKIFGNLPVGDIICNPSWRKLVDTNRDPSDGDAQSGWTKTVLNQWGQPLYDEPPPEHAVQSLAERHAAHNRAITEHIRSRKHRIVMQCHTMFAVERNFASSDITRPPSSMSVMERTANQIPW